MINAYETFGKFSKFFSNIILDRFVDITHQFGVLQLFSASGVQIQCTNDGKMDLQVNYEALPEGKTK